VESLTKEGEEICLRLDASIPSMGNASKGTFRHSQVAGKDFTIHAHAASTQPPAMEYGKQYFLSTLNDVLYWTLHASHSNTLLTCTCFNTIILCHCTSDIPITKF